MTEYTTSPEAIREWMTSRERTSHWISAHSRDNAGNILLSPSAPPSVIADSDIPDYGPSDSDNESSHSLPPRMILRYEDGRPDVPIPSEHRGSRLRSNTHSKESSSVLPPTFPSHSIRSRSKSSSQPISAVSSSFSQHTQPLAYTAPSHQPSLPPPPPRSPESIMVLPSRAENTSPQSTIHAGQNSPQSINHHSRSYSRTNSSQSALPIPPPIPRPGIFASVRHGLPSGATAQTIPPHQRSHHNSVAPSALFPKSTIQQSVIAPTPRHAYHPSQISHAHSQSYPSHRPRSPAMTFSQSQPLPTGANGGSRFLEPRLHPSSQLPYDYSPPAIVYAPSGKHPQSHYSPPAIIYSPSSSHHSGSHRGAAPSIVYSRSSPLPQNRYATYSGHRSQTRSHHASNIREEPRSEGHSRHHSDWDRRHDSTNPSRGRASPGARSPPGAQSRSPTPSLSDASETSGSTYYVLPTPGQKVQIIVPNASSLYKATSPSKSAQSPQSPHSASSGLKKPFFQRIFTIPKFSAPSSYGSGTSGKRLQRRHTIGGPQLQNK